MGPTTPSSPTVLDGSDEIAAPSPETSTSAHRKTSASGRSPVPTHISRSESPTEPARHHTPPSASQSATGRTSPPISDDRHSGRSGAATRVRPGPGSANGAKPHIAPSPLATAALPAASCGDRRAVEARSLGADAHDNASAIRLGTPRRPRTRATKGFRRRSRTCGPATEQGRALRGFVLHRGEDRSEESGSLGEGGSGVMAQSM